MTWRYPILNFMTVRMFSNLYLVTDGQTNRQTLSPHTHTSFFFWQVHKTAKVTTRFVLSVYPFICKEQLGSHWMDFHKIWYLGTFWKPVKKIQVSLISDTNNEYFTWSPSTFILSRSMILRMRHVSDKSCREIHNTHIIWCIQWLFSKYGWDNLKNTVVLDKPQMTI
jgi:hypothetical protein